MFHNVSQADTCAMAFNSFSLDIRKMRLSKYLPFTSAQTAVRQLVVHWM